MKREGTSTSTNTNTNTNTDTKDSITIIDTSYYYIWTVMCNTIMFINTITYMVSN